MYTGESDLTAFEEATQVKATGLATTPFGEELLHTIGYTYVHTYRFTTYPIFSSSALWPVSLEVVC